MRILLVVVLLTSCAWLAVNVALVAVVAPSLFSHAPPHADLVSKFLAGELFGDLLQRWIGVADTSAWPLTVLTMCILSGYALRDRNRLAGGACLAAVVGLIALHLCARQVVAEAWAIRPPVKEAERANYSEETHAAFDVLHHRSVMLFGLETVLLRAVVLGSAGVLMRGQLPLRPSAADPPR